MRYRTIVADPPWHYDGFASGINSKSQGVKLRWDVPVPYPTMTVADISALPVADLADTNARLFLWTTNRYLPDSFDVMAAWGFQFRQMIVWHKSNHPTPFVTSIAVQATEYLMYAVKGNPVRIKEPFPSTCIKTWRPRKNSHSRKPEMFIDLIEATSDGPYLELFARRQRLGWDTWGNEALDHIDYTAVGVPQVDHLVDIEGAA